MTIQQNFNLHDIQNYYETIHNIKSEKLIYNIKSIKILWWISWILTFIFVIDWLILFQFQHLYLNIHISTEKSKRVKYSQHYIILNFIITIVRNYYYKNYCNIITTYYLINNKSLKLYHIFICIINHLLTNNL